MLNDITIYCLLQFFPEIMYIDWISVTQRLHNHSSEYFCTFKIKFVDICKIMLMVLTPLPQHLKSVVISNNLLMALNNRLLHVALQLL